MNKIFHRFLISMGAMLIAVLTALPAAAQPKYPPPVPPARPVPEAPPAIPVTGADITLGVVLLVALLMAGAVALLWGRRRSRASA